MNQGLTNGVHSVLQVCQNIKPTHLCMSFPPLCIALCQLTVQGFPCFFTTHHKNCFVECFCFVLLIRFYCFFPVFLWCPWSCQSCMKQFGTILAVIFVFSSTTKNLKNKIKLKCLCVHDHIINKDGWLAR